MQLFLNVGTGFFSVRFSLFLRDCVWENGVTDIWIRIFRIFTKNFSKKLQALKFTCDSHGFGPLDYQWGIWCEKNCYLKSCSCHTFRIQQDTCLWSWHSSDWSKPMCKRSEKDNVRQFLPKIHLLWCSLAKIFSTPNSPSLFPFLGSVGIVMWRLCLIAPAPFLYYSQKYPPQ